LSENAEVVRAPILLPTSLADRRGLKHGVAKDQALSCNEMPFPEWRQANTLCAE